MLETFYELTIHQRNLQVLMTEIYEIVNGVALPIMSSLFGFRSNKYNIRNFQVLSTDFKEHNIMAWKQSHKFVPSLWAKLSSGYKLAGSLEECKVKLRNGDVTHIHADYAKTFNQILD